MKRTPYFVWFIQFILVTLIGTIPSIAQGFHWTLIVPVVGMIVLETYRRARVNPITYHIIRSM